MKEISETFAHSRVVVEEVDSKLQDEYDSRLREALQQIREDNEEQIKMMRIETEAVFEKKVVFRFTTQIRIYFIWRFDLILVACDSCYNSINLFINLYQLVY